MKPPIIIVENGDVSFFASVRAAEIYMEPVDVKNNEYIAYDSEGRLLNIKVLKNKVIIKNTDLIRDVELRDVLAHFFRRVENVVSISPEKLQIATLKELVDIGLMKFLTK